MYEGVFVLVDANNGNVDFDVDFKHDDKIHGLVIRVDGYESDFKIHDVWRNRVYDRIVRNQRLDDSAILVNVEQGFEVDGND